MIAAPVQCDVDGIPKGSHYVSIPPSKVRSVESSIASSASLSERDTSVGMTPVRAPPDRSGDARTNGSPQRQLDRRLERLSGRIRPQDGAGLMAAENDVTALLVAWGQGDRAADSRSTATVPEDLRRVARRRLRSERAGHSLAPTALVHESCVRRVDLRRVRWQHRALQPLIAVRGTPKEST